MESWGGSIGTRTRISPGSTLASGSGGISEEQQKMLASYVHDMGGGLVNFLADPDYFENNPWHLWPLFHSPGSHLFPFSP